MAVSHLREKRVHQEYFQNLNQACMQIFLFLNFCYTLLFVKDLNGNQSAAQLDLQNDLFLILVGSFTFSSSLQRSH